MRKIKKVILHCSDSDVAAHDHISVIREWHTKRGFVGPDGIAGSEDDVGYHWFIDRNGGVAKGRDEKHIGAHAKGHNSDSIGVCLSGRTFPNPHTHQFTAARALVVKILEQYGLKKEDVYLHRTFDGGKPCPNFSLEFFWDGKPWLN